MNTKLSELLPVDSFFVKEYHQVNQHGEKYLQNKRITIISLARNIDNHINTNIPLVYNFLTDLGIVCNWIIFENDSIDNTKISLQNLSKKNTNIHVISENLSREHYGPVKSTERIQALSEYRNKAQKYANNISSDFVLVLDLDFIDINLEGILNSFGWLSIDDNIHAIAGNSFEYKKGLTSSDPNAYNLWNYDSWAFRNNWWTDLHNSRPAPNNTIDPMLWFGLWIPPTGSRPIKVNSAFGGSCIYRSNIYFKGNYDYQDCEHVCFHYSLSKVSNNFTLVLNPSQQMLF
jgi:hypothetical protein